MICDVYGAEIVSPHDGFVNRNDLISEIAVSVCPAYAVLVRIDERV